MTRADAVHTINDAIQRVRRVGQLPLPSLAARLASDAIESLGRLQCELRDELAPTGGNPSNVDVPTWP